jgi:hypothetical protein
MTADGTTGQGERSRASEITVGASNDQGKTNGDVAFQLERTKETAVPRT